MTTNNQSRNIPAYLYRDTYKTTPYLEHLKNKLRFSEYFGLDIDQSEINPILKPHQRDIVQWAVKGGRRALFEAFGLGKTVQELEILRILQKHDPGPYLIICPLGVRHQFRHDAKMLGWTEELPFINRSDQITGDHIYITNYEPVRDGKLDPTLFKGVSLDEAAVLRSFGSKTYQTFLTLFDAVKYRFVATATPDPNRFKELIHYAGFLGISDTGAALTKYFQRDSQKAGNLTLYPHMETEFWTWIHSWAIFLQSPADLGYDATGYELPEMEVIWHEVKSGDYRMIYDRQSGQGDMFPDSSTNVSTQAAEKRTSMDVRIAKMQEIIGESPENHFLLWHDLDDELDAIRKAIPEVSWIHGSRIDLDERERRLVDFTEGRSKYFASKPILSGTGANFQYFCHDAIFLGIGFKFHDLIQAVHRLHRYQQVHKVRLHLVYTDKEDRVRRALETKWANHNEKVKKMSQIIREHGLSAMGMEQALQRAIGIDRVSVSGKDWELVNNDTVPETKSMESDSVGLIVTSIPFSKKYEYSTNASCMGYNKDNAAFWEQMDYLTPQLLRVLQPGRLCCVHIKDFPVFGSANGLGHYTVDPLHAEAIFHYQKHGFAYCGLIFITTDVVQENNQTYRLGWTENAKDGTKMGVGSPEFVLLFRKTPTETTDSYADVPVTKSKKDYSRSRWQIDAHALWASSGNRLLDSDEIFSLESDGIMAIWKAWSKANIYDYEFHVRIGENLDTRSRLPSKFMQLPTQSYRDDVWTDVARMRTLNGNQRRKNLQMHLCPFSFSIVERLIIRYSNPGELVYDPFSGLGTVPLLAVKHGRKGLGCELNAGYWADSANYLHAQDEELSIPDLFAALEINQDRSAA